jgi:ribonuclease VapC
VIVDSSALVAILRAESDAEVYANAIAAAERVRVSPASLLEASIALGPPGQRGLDELAAEIGIEVVPMDEAQSRIARRAHLDYGRGSESNARLNLGDCIAYALATVTGEPLLFKGDHFRHTDVMAALPPVTG